MAESIARVSSRLFGNGHLLTAVLSVVPVTEIKGSILFAVAAGRDPLLSAVIAYAASLLLCAVLSYALPKAFERARNRPHLGKLISRIARRMEAKAKKLGSDAEKCRKRKEEKMLFGVFCFVALPFPMTGVWSGALLGVLLGLSAKKLFFALAAGNFAAGGMVLAAAIAFGEKSRVLLDCFLGLIIAVLLLSFLKRKKRSAKEEGRGMLGKGGG